MASISTHILDTSLGCPAANIEVILEAKQANQTNRLLVAKTNADGRLDEKITAVEPGEYRITFLTKPYFQSANRETFYPHVQIDFTVSESDAHFHVPLLISGFGFSTYRGS